ncbi:MAG: T9SS type A sorting domain-containing protein [Flavobacteriaceae bacterium]
MKTICFLLFQLVTIGLFSQNITIPDANFKAYLVGNPAININGDTEIQLSEAVEYTGDIICPNLNISSLIGIEEFINIEELNCKNNNLTSLNLSQNTLLTALTAQGNQISNLTLNTVNSQLWFIDVGVNQLTTFQPSNHPLLEILVIHSNQLTVLDVSQNPFLENLRCDSNLLTTLNLDNNPLLYNLLCNNNQLTSLSLTQNPALFNLDCYNNQITTLNVTQNPLLENLRCNNNPLSGLNVTQNNHLIKLICSNNSLTSLNVSQNILLDELHCGLNMITSLDLTQNTNLTKIVCNFNDLNFLNVKNTNNLNVTVFSAISNPNLPCIIVDDAAYSTANWTSIDIGTVFSETQDGCTILSAEDFKNNTDFNVYPNPSDTQFTIEYDGEIDSIQLFNAFGQKIIETNNKTVQVENITSGIYFLKVHSKERILTKKIIIKSLAYEN